MSQPDLGDWATYWRSPDGQVEAMHTHFRGHVYHRHSHETYSFGVTETGAQAFTCRGTGHVSAAGMVMAFNPDDPHDGHTATAAGFTYRMIHLRPALLLDVLADMTGRAAAAPLFTAPVVGDAAFGAAVRRLHASLTGPASERAGAGEGGRTEQGWAQEGAKRGGGNKHSAGAGTSPERGWAQEGAGAKRGGGNKHSAGAGTSTALERAELLTATVVIAARHAVSPGRPAQALRAAGDLAAAADRVRGFLHDNHADTVTLADVAEAAGCSRFAAYRAFRGRYGLPPSEYQRQLRLRAARRALAGGAAVADVAAAAGFADQAHLTRWFRRCYGITPGDYRRACAG
jgi:AraC-like DNA-binding protein